MTAVYRMTHIHNICHVLEYGITKKNSVNANPNYVQIGDLSLIEIRDGKIVVVDNGDLLKINSKKINLGDFIPFYFGIKMPMLYIVQMGGNFVEKATNPADVIYLVCYIEKIIEKNFEFYFSDGHGTNNYTTFYDKSKFENLREIIDWNAITSQYWGGNDNLDMKRKKQAEFLVSNDVGIDLIIGFGCSNETVKIKLLEMGIEESKIKVIPNAYF